ncbi:MAG: aminoacyl-tRNA hydrolase [Thermoanaerobaculia bacterium]|nr:aminoacyl-tRNA hydrolase [Thermoanaerobaculia bacterium]
MRIVAGLGNPGKRYAGTRHNVGFRVVRELARRRGVQAFDEACGSLIARADDRPALVMPQTYMNRSGFALRCLAERHQLETGAFLVVYDEVHLPLGALRLRPKGSPAGHRGLESVLENLGTDEVPRLRLGVGAAEGPPDGADLVDFVLSNFEESEQETVEVMIQRAADACEIWAIEGSDAAMQRFNRSSPTPDSEEAGPDSEEPGEVAT